MSNEIPNFNLLAVFAAVMEQGSLSKAAEHLNTNQSTISTALGRLKKEIGQELFIRSGRGVVPTSYAVHLFSQIQHPIQHLNGVFQSLGHFDPNQSERQFVITAPEHLQWVLLDQFSKNSDSALSLEVFDQPEDDDKMYDALLTQRYDVMIDIVDPEHLNIKSQKLFDGDFVIVCSQKHPRIKDQITEAQFMSEYHAVLERKRSHLHSLHHFTDLDLSKRKIAYHGRSLFSNLLLCSQSNYLTVVPLSLALQFQERLELQLFKPPFEYKKISNYLIWLKKLDNDPAHMWLKNEIITISNNLVNQKSMYL